MSKIIGLNIDFGICSLMRGKIHSKKSLQPQGALERSNRGVADSSLPLNFKSLEVAQIKSKSPELS